MMVMMAVVVAVTFAVAVALWLGKGTAILAKPMVVD